MRREPAHVPALDGVRAIAVLLVLLVHCDMFLYFGYAKEGTPLLGAIRNVSGIGWTGVDLFFVLSGMLITGILLDSKGGAGYFTSFYSRRTLRIFPLYYAALLLLVVVLPRVAGGLLHDSAVPRPDTWSLWLYLTNVTVARHESWGVIPPLTSHFWSLAVEEQFYLLWPFLVWWLSRRQLRRLAVVLIVAPVFVRLLLTHLGNHTLGGLILLPARIDTLAVGAMIAILARDPGGLERLRRWAPPAAALSILGFLAVCWMDGNPADYGARMQRYGFTCTAIGYAALLVMVLTASPAAPLVRLFSTRSLRWIGARSYGMYVWHPVALRALAVSRAPQRAPLAALPLPFHQLALYLAAVCASALMAEISWRVIESPFLSLKRFFPRPVGRTADGARDGDGETQLVPPVAAAS